jgi:hypothetical protein
VWKISNYVSDRFIVFKINGLALKTFLSVRFTVFFFATSFGFRSPRANAFITEVTAATAAAIAAALAALVAIV